MVSESEKGPLFEARHELRKELVHFPVIIDQDPELWWYRTAKFVKRLEQRLKDKPEEVAEYVGAYLPAVMNMLREEAELGCVPPGQNPAEYNALRTETRMLELSMMMAKQFDHETETVRENITPLEDLPKRHPDNFRLGRIEKEGVEFFDLQVRPNVNRPFSQLLIPVHEPIGHKGGGPRGVFDIDVGAPQSMIESEFPWNDIDVVGAGEENHLRNVANIMGIDPDGLEVFPGDKVDFSNFALGRDTDQNQLFLDAAGLHYSDAALAAAQTGHIHIVGGYEPNRAIYGSDLYYTGKLTLYKPRGEMRLIKPVSEGKALEFEYMDINQVMDFGVFFLFLGRKWKTKEKFGLYMQRMYHVGKLMGQVREGEENIMQVFDRVHNQYPFYDMDKRIQNMRELARYMSGKLVKQIDREFGWKYKIPSGIELTRTPGDDIPRRINLEGFEPSEKMTVQLQEWWPGFLKQCRKRTDAFNAQPVDPMFRYFIKTEIQDAETEPGDFERE